MDHVHATRFNWRRILAALALPLLAAGVADAATPPAQIAVSPSRFELSIGSKPTTQSISLVNLGQEDVNIEVSTATWDLDEANSVRIVPPDEQSLDQWLVINPLRFTVPGGLSQTVRFSVRPRVAPAAGEHRAMIYFNQVLPPSSEKILRVKFSLGVAVYGLAGEVIRVGRLHGVRVVPGTNPVLVGFDVSSEGNAHVRLNGRYALVSGNAVDASASTGPDPAHPVVAAGSLPGKPVLPHTRRELMLRVPQELPPGRYLLELQGELAGEPIDIEVPVMIPASDLVAESDSQAHATP